MFGLLASNGFTDLLRNWYSQTSNFGYWARGIYRTNVTVPKDRKADYLHRDYMSPLITAYIMELSMRTLDRYFQNPLLSDALGVVPQFGRDDARSGVERFYDDLRELYQGKVNFDIDPETVKKVQSIDHQFGNHDQDYLRKVLNHTTVRSGARNVGIANAEKKLKDAGLAKEYQYLTHYLKSRIRFEDYLKDLKEFKVINGDELDALKAVTKSDALEGVFEGYLDNVYKQFRLEAFNWSTVPGVQNLIQGDKGQKAVQNLHDSLSALHKASGQLGASIHNPEAVTRHLDDALAKVPEYGFTNPANWVPKRIRRMLNIATPHNVEELLTSAGQAQGFRVSDEVRQTLAVMLGAKKPQDLRHIKVDKSSIGTMKKLIAGTGEHGYALADVVKGLQDKIAAHIPKDVPEGKALGVVKALDEKLQGLVGEQRLKLMERIVPMGKMSEAIEKILPQFNGFKNTKSYLNRIGDAYFWPKSLFSTAIFFAVIGVGWTYLDNNVVQPWQREVVKKKGTTEMLSNPVYASVIPGALAAFGVGRLLPKTMGYLPRFAIMGGAYFVTLIASAVGAALLAVKHAPDVPQKKDAPKPQQQVPPTVNPYVAYRPAIAPQGQMGQQLNLTAASPWQAQQAYGQLPGQQGFGQQAFGAPAAHGQQSRGYPDPWHAPYPSMPPMTGPRV